MDIHSKKYLSGKYRGRKRHQYPELCKYNRLHEGFPMVIPTLRPRSVEPHGAWRMAQAAWRMARPGGRVARSTRNVPHATCRRVAMGRGTMKRWLKQWKGGGPVRPTMSDVARAAAVSTSTVSRALAGDPRVKEETRRRIAAVAKRMGYTPNRTATALRRGKTWMIGVATPGTPRAFSDPFYLEFLGGLGDRAMEAGYNLVIAAPSSRAHSPTQQPSRQQSPGQQSPRPEGSRAEAAASAPDSLLTSGPSLARTSARGLDLEGLISQGAVDAVALTEPAVDDARLALLRRYRVPFAFLGTPEEDGRVPEDVPYVDGDNIGSAREAVEHLIALGHRRIACLTGEAGLAATQQRLAGYLQAMKAAGLSVDPRWVVPGDSTERGGRRAMEQLLQPEPGAAGARGVGAHDRHVVPTAVFASNDLMAIGALRAVRAAGLRVPEDVSIVGFDGIPLAELVEPPLTTVKQPIYEFGRTLADLLLAQLEPEAVEPGSPPVGTLGPIPIPTPTTARPQGRGHIVSGRFVLRASTAPPASASSGRAPTAPAATEAADHSRPVKAPREVVADGQAEIPNKCEWR